MIIDSPLTSRLDGAADAFTAAWLDTVAARPGNPRRLSFLRRDGVLAPASEQLPANEPLNHVVGLRPEQADAVRDIVRWYRHKGIWPWFDVSPGAGSDRLFDVLAAEGAWPIGFAATLVGEVTHTSVPLVAGVAVEAVRAATLGEFVTTFAAGRDDEPDGSTDVDAWFDVPDTRLLLARVNGLPVGTAAICCRDGVALLVDATVRPEARGRGVYQALTGARLRLARQLRCELVTARAPFGSAAHRSLQELGLASCYTRVVLRLGG